MDWVDTMGLKGLREYLLKWRITRLEDRLIEDKPPQTVILMGATQTADDVVRLALNAAGEVTEASAAATANYAAGIADATRTGNPLYWTAAGVPVGYAAARAWIPIPPITITADGAGNPPATAMIPLAAGDLIDVMVFMDNDLVAGANQYIHRFRTDPIAAVGGIAPVDPAWAAVEIPVLADGTTPRANPYGHRMITTAVASAWGIGEGVNADWPNAAQVTFSGFYRYI